MDDSLSQDEGVRARIDSVGQNTFFSTTTEESSTDSLDVGGSDTERALEEIRRQYYEGQQHSSSASAATSGSSFSGGGGGRKESEELFFPRRSGAGLGGGSAADKKRSLYDSPGSPLAGVFGEEEKESVDGASSRLSGVVNRESLKSADGDDENNGSGLLLPDDVGRSSNNYFISPASSRQTTVEKSPTLFSSADDDCHMHSGHDGDDEHGTRTGNKNGDRNDNNNNKDLEEDIALHLEKNGKEKRNSGDVKIVVSSFSSSNVEGKSWRSSSTGSKSEDDTKSCKNVTHGSSSNRLSVDHVQATSSDSGSSSSGATTVFGGRVRSSTDTDGATPRNVLSEESDGITDKDSISRTHSPCGFPQLSLLGSARQRAGSSQSSVTLTSSVCQTSEVDFDTAARAELGEAVNATVRRSTLGVLHKSRDNNICNMAVSDIGVKFQTPSISIDDVTVIEGGAGKSRENEESSEGGSKVKLSALPPTINPLELMRRLRHSQDEFLRAGSVQSDSSGFGDADPTTDSGHFECDQPKVQSLGSSHESDMTTLANSFASSQQRKQHQHDHTGDMATQTSSTNLLQSEATSSSTQTTTTTHKESPRPDPNHSSFITTCFIPSLNQREGHMTTDGLRHRRTNIHHQRSSLQSHASPLPCQPPHYPHSSPHPYFIDNDDIQWNSSSGYKSEISASPDLRNQTASPYSVPYQPNPEGYDPYFSPHHPRRSSNQDFRYRHPPSHFGRHSDQEDYFSDRYPYRNTMMPPSRPQHSSRSDISNPTEWAGYLPREFNASQSLHYSYRYNHTPPPYPDEYFQSRHRSLDYYDFPHGYDRYGADFNYSLDGRNSRIYNRGYSDNGVENMDISKRHLRRLDNNNTNTNKSMLDTKPKKFTSQLELYTTEGGKLELSPTKSPQTLLRRSQLVDEREMVNAGSYTKTEPKDDDDDDDDDIEDDDIARNSGSPSRRNQVPLSEELAAAMGNRAPPPSESTSVILSPLVSASPQRNKSVLVASVNSASSTSVYAEGGKDGNIVSSIFIPPSPRLTVTPATPDVKGQSTQFKNLLATPQLSKSSAITSSISKDGETALNSPQKENSFSVADGTLPALAGNLRTFPQGKPDGTLINNKTPQSSVITSTSTPLSSVAVTPVSTTAAAAFRSRKQQKSCDILDDDESFSEGDPLAVERQEKDAAKNKETPVGASSSFISHVYHDTKAPVYRIPTAETDHNISQHSRPVSLEFPLSSQHRLLNQHSSNPYPNPSRQFYYPPHHPNYPASSPHSFSPVPTSHRHSFSSSMSLPPMPNSGHPLSLPHSFSRGSDDLEGNFSSSIAESSSELSFHSSPGKFTDRAGVLDARKLARLINQPVYFKGSKRPGGHYRPRRLFREWAMLSKRKRLQEENRLLQASLAKYKTELSILESSLKVDFTSSLSDMSPEERESVTNLEMLWSEVKGQVQEMERLILSRVKSVQSGNNFHQLLANLGVIDKVKDLIKEQMYQQQVVSSRGEDADEEDNDNEDENIATSRVNQSERRDSFNNIYNDYGDLDLEDTPDDLEMFDDDYDVEPMRNSLRHGGTRNRSYDSYIPPGVATQSRASLSHSWVTGVGPSSTPRLNPRLRGHQLGRSSSSSTSNVPVDVNVSLEQIKTSLLSQMQQEIRDSTRKLEIDLQTKDKEIEELKRQMGHRPTTSTPDLAAYPWRRSSSERLRSTSAQGYLGSTGLRRSHSRSRMMGDRIVQETDV